LEVTRPIVLRAVAAAEKLFECLSELRAEDRVDNGIEGRVEVAQPQEEAEDPRFHAALETGFPVFTFNFQNPQIQLFFWAGS